MRWREKKKLMRKLIPLAEEKVLDALVGNKATVATEKVLEKD